jgi:hypothetical protein
MHTVVEIQGNAQRYHTGLMLLIVLATGVLTSRWYLFFSYHWCPSSQRGLHRFPLLEQSLYFYFALRFLKSCNFWLLFQWRPLTEEEDQAAANRKLHWHNEKLNLLAKRQNENRNSSNKS